MNEEMNNNYNSAPNYNYEKKNNGVKVLLIVLIVLVLCLIGLTAYKMLVFDKKNDNRKDNNVVDNNKTDDNKDNNGNENNDSNNKEGNNIEQEKEENAYINYLNKLSSEISNKYVNDENSIAPNNVEQFMTSERVGGYEKLSYSLTISKDKVLMLNSEKIAENVLEYFVVDKGNGGAKSLYYIDANGDLYSVSHEAYLSGDTDLNSKKLSYKNIVSVLPGITPNSRNPIFIDIEGNIYIG